MGNLNLAALHHCSSSSSSPLNPGSSLNPGSPSFEPPHDPDGYLSDDPVHASSAFATRRSSERKKGMYLFFLA